MRLINFKSVSKLGLVSLVVISMPMLLTNSAPAQAQIPVPNLEFSSQSNQFFREGDLRLEQELKIINSNLEPIEIKLPSNSDGDQHSGQSNSWSTTETLPTTSNSTSGDLK